jgi:hypothetical protein
VEIRVRPATGRRRTMSDASENRLRRISQADLRDPWDEIRAIQQEIRLDYQWKLLVELTGSEQFAATVVERTPGMGVPRQAREILEMRAAL